jgi:geranylgeranyl pyrophosphate synthase
LQYQVLIAEGSPAILQLLLTGKADAVLGVGCLNSLEKCFDKLQIAGIPALAVPLHTSACQDSQTDIDWVMDMIRTPYQANVSGRILTPAECKLTPRSLQNLFDTLEPAAANVTAALAIGFLKRGGKFYRPYIMLAVFNVLTGQTLGNRIDDLPDYLLNTARTIEIFHKASLLHDDVEDDDPFRYGKPTLHRTHGTATAINAGDYLLGYGYQLIAKLRQSVAADIVTEMLAVLSMSHCRLSSGQGAELYWSQQTEVPPVTEVIKFYVGKTSPAFEAALCLGVLAAVQANGVDWDFYHRYKETFYRFTKHLGVAFQIKNDLADWQTDGANKVVAGGDALQNRPTLLRSLANGTGMQSLSVQEMYDMFVRQGVFEQADKLVRQFSDKAYETVQVIDHQPLRELLNQLVAITG